METLRDDLSESQWADAVDDLEAESPVQADENADASEEEPEIQEEDPLEAGRRLEDEEAAKRNELLAKEKERRRKKAAKVIQKGVRNWIRRKRGGISINDFLGALKSFISSEQNKVKQAVKGRTLQEDATAKRMDLKVQLFGMDAMSLRKPAVVEEYMAQHNLRKLLTAELSNLFKAKEFPTNPFPHLYRSLSAHHTASCEQARLSDAHLKKMLEARADVVFKGSRDTDGRKLPITCIEVQGPNTADAQRRGANEGAQTEREGLEGVSIRIYGEVPALLTTDPVMLRRLAVALGALLRTVKKQTQSSGKLIVGRALVGPCIHHFEASPFPASVEITDECFGVGGDFEALLVLYCDHVISDAVQVTHAGYHQHLGAGGGEICLAVAGASQVGGGELPQLFERWPLADILHGSKRSAFVAALQSNTVNKRANFLDILLQVR